MFKIPIHGGVDLFGAYRNKVYAGGGSIRNEFIAKTILNYYKNSGQRNNLRLLVAPELGMTVFNDGTDLNVSKLYSVDSVPNDVVQGTAANQPYLAGDIAPTEKYCLNNPNGATRFMTHPTISYSATDKWSLTFVCNFNSTKTTGNYFIGKNSNSESIIGLKNTNKILFVNESGSQIESNVLPYSIFGKTSVFSFSASGDNNLKIYINGNIFQTLSIQTNITLTQIINAINNVLYYFEGKISIYKIQNGEIEVKAEYDMLRSIYPEIESVQIGTQTWATSNFEAVATPIGNVIGEVTSNINTNIVVNGTFDADTNWNKASLVTISSGKINIPSGAGVNTTQSYAGYKVNYYYKITFTISNYVSGIIKIGIGGSTAEFLQGNADGTFSKYLKFTGATAMIFINNSSSFVGSVDDLIIEEIGWANSTELYNGLIAQGSTVANATKEAAMWCHYSNSAANGAIYGKLYNWYAVKLLQTDIDAYNTANPTNRWGWHVPTQAEFNTLATYLGGASVAGGKLKKEGLTYWNTPNTGATNESGFSAIGGGYRNASGSFTNRTGGVYFVTITNSGIYFTYYALDASSISLLSSEFANKIFGISLRLIKD